MRIKWNRHLDGSSSRQEGGSETQETDEGKRGASSSPAIFRIFRRKKNKKRGDDESKTSTSNFDGTVPPLLPEADEDDSASINSAATCASQPVSEVRHRDRASSLFSSFRLSLPGSKRKKRRIAPIPSETLISKPENDHQMERYSTPDLRKPSEKLDVPSDIQVNHLSTSSPSVRNPREISKKHSLDQNIESVEKNKSLNSTFASSNSKLSKSVSFSNCGDDLNDFSHSLRDKISPRAVSSSAMVEEDSRALESELALCMSDNLRKNHEGKSNSDDHSSSSVADVSSPRKHRDDAVVDTVGMTKAETATGNSSDAVENNTISDINSILSDIASEIRSYRKPKDDQEICNREYSHEGDIVLSKGNCAFKNSEKEYNNGICIDRVHMEVKSNEKKIFPQVQSAEIQPIMSPKQEWNTLSEVCDNSNRNISLLSQENSYIVPESDKPSTELTSNENMQKLFPVEPLVVTCSKDLPNLNSVANNFETNFNQGSRIDAINDSEGVEKQSGSLEKPSAIENTRHVICHMRVYENESIPEEVNGFSSVGSEMATPESQKKEISCEFLTVSNLPQKADFSNVVINPHKLESKDFKNILPSFSVADNSEYKLKKSAAQLIRDLNLNSSQGIDSCIQNKLGGDQEVPNGKFRLFKCPGKSGLVDSLPFHEVPEFELSLLEFEDVCNKYASRRGFEFSDFNSAIPHYSDFPKRKSVLDTSYSFIYPHFNENSGIKDSASGIISPILAARTGLIKQDLKIRKALDLEDTCQSVADKGSLPLPPKQWINYEKPIESKYNSNVCTDRVQCTEVHGKNLCQEPCLEALPTTVMLDDSDLGSIDTPEVSSTHQTVQNKSGREYVSDVASKTLQVSNRSSQPTDMLSSVSLAINGVLDFSCVSETPSKSSVYLDPQISESYCSQRTVCDVYSDVTKELEKTLVSRNYLDGHNFCDMRSVNLCNVINDVPCDFVQSGSRLIEIANPYQEDPYIIPHETSNQMFINHVAFEPVNVCDSDHTSITPVNKSPQDVNIEMKENESTKEFSCKDKSPDIHENGNVLPENESVSITANGDGRSKQHRLSYTEQKNIINKNKSSMIPCLRKKNHDSELKRTETKSKTGNSPLEFHKTEFGTQIQNTSSRRVFSNQSKDPGVENSVNRQKKSPKKYNGIASDVTEHEMSKPKKRNREAKSSSVNVEIMVGKKLEVYIKDDTNSDRTWETSDHSANVKKSDKEVEHNLVDLNHNVFSSEADVISKFSKNVSPSLIITEDVSNCCNPSEVPCIESEVILSDCIKGSDINRSTVSVPAEDLKNSDFGEGFYSDFSAYDHKTQDEILRERYSNDTKYEDYDTSSRRSSITGVSLLKMNFMSSKESLNSQMTSSSRRSVGKSRIPRKQAGTRGAQPSTKGPVRPPMWLSKAELTQEIQRLGTLCEARTKELNRLKMETKHVSSGFDAFASLFKYMVEDLNGLSVPKLKEDLEKTLKQLELTKQDLAYYEREVEEMKSHHCQELNDLSNKLFEVYQSEVAELNAKHQEEINHLTSEHQSQIEHLTSNFDASSTEAKAHHEKLIANLEQEIINQREELQLFQEREIKDLEDKHAESTKMLHEHIEQLQKKCAELKQHSMSMEDAMRKDTDSKLQWVTSVKVDLEKEVESLKAVLEMKNKELHTIRVQNLEMEKQLEELPLAREKIKMLQARAEDLEALMMEKTKVERKLLSENQQIQDTYEKEAKVNRRLSMENEELQWRLRQAENSLISGSFTEVPEFPEDTENTATSPTKSPGHQIMSRSVFFTFVDKDESSPLSPRTQYKKITPNFSANYKTSPAKSSKSPPAPSPRRAKSHSEPPQPMAMTSTPRKNAKLPLCKTKGTQRRQRSGSDSSRLVSDHTEVTFSSVTESMASSVSSESSVFEHKERLLEEHKEHIIQSLEILREQRSSESADESTIIEKKWSSDDIKVTGELSKLEADDMSRSAEFADPKTYYHMTFPVLKESGINDCDMEDGSKNLSSGSSPVKEFMPNTMHSMSEDNINYAVETDGQIIQAMSKSSHEVSVTLVADEKIYGCSESVNKRNSISESTVATENVQNDCEVAENRWRTI